MYFIFSLIALLCWSGSDIFSKLGTSQNDKNSHWHVVFFVGLIMGIHAILTIIIGKLINPEAVPSWLLSVIYTDFKIADFFHYLPVACIYILAMVFGYVGLRYLELSVLSPICNSSGSLALVICIIFGLAKPDLITGIAVALITLGIIFLSITEYREDEEIKALRQQQSNFKYSKSLIALIIPIAYLVLDALGTVGDQVISEFELFDMTEYASNTSFELTFLLFSVFAFIYVKVIKKQKFFAPIMQKNGNKLTLKTYIILDGVCETLGQLFYMAVIFSDFDAGMPMISAFCVMSVLLSRIFLKEKLSFKHYVAIIITFIGIILLGIFSEI